MYSLDAVAILSVLIFALVTIAVLFLKIYRAPDSIPLVLKITLPFAIFLMLFSIFSLVYSNDDAYNSFLFSNRWSAIIFTMVINIMALFLIDAIKRDSKHLSVATVALIGFPNAGKTVYITALFHKLLLKSGTCKNIQPYGEETTDRVLTDYGKLRGGNMLPPTGSDIFYYRAKFLPSGLNLKPQYKLEIADYAGECLQKELDANENFFHKTAYFKYIVTCDAVFFTIDSAEFINGPIKEYVNFIESSFIATLHRLKEQTNVFLTKKAKIPVVLMFLKTDCLKKLHIDESNKNVRDELLSWFQQLITYCENNFAHFNCFFISSFAEIYDEYTAVKDDIEGPLLWVMERIK